MKSNVLLTSMTVLLASVTGANALDYRPFVGATIGLQEVMYSNHAKDFERLHQLDYPTDFFAFGIETGVRAGSYNHIYNGGITLAATKTTYSKTQHKYDETKKADNDLFSVSATYDNFIRISGDKESRIDLVLGGGFGALAYHVDPVAGGSETVWSFAEELKVGLDFELTHSVTLSASARVLVPARKHYEAEASYIVGGAVKYMF